jgi:hypothetical protein
MNIMAMHGTDERINIVCPGGVFANVTALMRGDAAKAADLALMSTKQPATQLCVLSLVRFHLHQM